MEVRQIKMETKRTKVIRVEEPFRPDREGLAEAGEILRAGGLVVFPTETVYGLGANALDPDAVSGIFRAKGRPSDNPLIIHICKIDQVYELADDFTVQAQRAAEAFWPGPLTLILPKKACIPAQVTAGLNTVALRMPDNPVALALLETAGIPVAAPSANTSGRPSPTTVDHVLRDLDGKVDVVVDGGSCRIGLESTVLDMTSEPPVILRPGGVSREDLEGVLGHTDIDASSYDHDSPGIPRSPGMKYRHYAPKAKVVLVNGKELNDISNKVNELIANYHSQNLTVGVLASGETVQGYGAEAAFPLGSRVQLETVAQNLFYGLRFLDDCNVDIIIAEGYPDEGIGTAIMNRLRKAAGGNLVMV